MQQLYIYLYLIYATNNYLSICLFIYSTKCIYLFIYAYIVWFFLPLQTFFVFFFSQHLSWLGLGPCRHYATYFGWPMVSVVLNVYLIWIVLNSTPIWRSKNSLSSSIYNFFHSCCLGANTPMMYMSWDRLVRWGGEGVGILGY